MSTPRQRYARVPTEDAATTRAAAKKRRSELAEQVATKIQAAAWVAAGGFVAYQTDLPVVLLAGTETNRFWCDVAAACFAANCVLCFYLTVWLPHVQRIDLEWNVYCPRVIPTMTVLGLTCGFSLIRGLWPVWGLLTPLIWGLSRWRASCRCTSYDTPRGRGAHCYRRLLGLAQLVSGRAHRPAASLL